MFSSITRNVILEKPSPVIFMRAKKNAVERDGMQRAHVLDGAALCDAFSLLERRVRFEKLRKKPPDTFRKTQTEWTKKQSADLNFTPDSILYLVFEFRDNHRDVRCR